MRPNSYKFARNHGLPLPTLPQRQVSQSISTHAILPKQEPSLYQLQANQQILHLFDRKQYLKASFNSILTDLSSAVQIVKHIMPYSLIVLLAQDRHSSDELILGKQGVGSVIQQVFQQFKSRKGNKSSIVLSVIGIEGENKLVDELNFQWLQGNKKIEGLVGVNSSRPHLRILKEGREQSAYAQSLTRQEVFSQQQLEGILNRFRDIKISRQRLQEESGHIGELYQIAQVEYDQQYGSLQRIISSCYILRLNQYMKSCGALTHRLRMCLYQRSPVQHTLVEMHESKILLLLAECFKPNNREKNYSIHILIQVGMLDSLRQEYLNLSVLWRDQSGTLTNRPFVYLKHYLEDAKVVSLVASLAKGEIKTFLEEGKVVPRIKTRSYYCQTISSAQKRVLKGSRQKAVATQEEVEMSLQQFVYEAAKLYRLASGNRYKQLKQIRKSRIKNRLDPNIIEEQEIIPKKHKQNFLNKVSPKTPPYAFSLKNNKLSSSLTREKRAKDSLTEIYGCRKKDGTSNNSKKYLTPRREQTSGKLKKLLSEETSQLLQKIAKREFEEELREQLIKDTEEVQYL